MFRRGVLMLGAGQNAVRLAPPLVLTKPQADIVLRVFDEALAEVARWRAGFSAEPEFGGWCRWL